MQLVLAVGLVQLVPLAVFEGELDFQAIESLLPVFVPLFFDAAGAGGHFNGQRLAVWQGAQAVGADLVAKAVQQGVGRCRVVLYRTLERRVVAGYAFRNDIVHRYRLAPADGSDGFAARKRHGNGATQGDFFLGVPPDYRVLHIEELVGDFQVFLALQLYALLGVFGLQLHV